IGQYICPHPNSDLIDRTTQQIRGCSKENKARGRFLKCIIL
ncbi:GSCOCG00012877001-RA-CDS, partial [Cotesia congregata]